MKTTGVVALSLLSLAAAAPHVQHRQMHRAKRDLVWVTATDEVVETVVQTLTVWVDPDNVPTATSGLVTPAYTPAVETTSSIAPTSTAPASSTETPASSTEAPSSSTEIPSSSTETPSSTYVAPSSTYVAPSSTYVAPSSTYVAPTSTYVAPTSTYVAPSSVESTSAAAEPTTSVVDKSVSTSSTGSVMETTKEDCEATYYNTYGGYGACGSQESDSEYVVALNYASFDAYKDQMCGKSITLSYEGKTAVAKIMDRCPGCDSSSWDLDLTPSLFEALAGSLDAGRLHGLSWWFN